MEHNKKQLELLKKRLSIISLVAVILYLFVVGASDWLSESVFAYEVEETTTVEEPYEFVVDEIWEYTCYTTPYGECYHESGCHYLSSSSKKTTVADAQNDGYRACSRCDPPRELPVIIKETRYRTVTKTETRTEEPKGAVWLICTGIYILIYYVATITIRKEIEKLEQIKISEDIGS